MAAFGTNAKCRLCWAMSAFGGIPLDAMWGGIDHQLYGIDGGRSAIDRYCLKKTSLGGLGLRLFHRLIPNSAISIEYFWNMAIRLLVNSAMTLRISTGDLIVASLWANSKANCMLACAISSSFA